jgi:hypothetical protein
LQERFLLILFWRGKSIPPLRVIRDQVDFNPEPFKIICQLIRLFEGIIDPFNQNILSKNLSPRMRTVNPHSFF